MKKKPMIPKASKKMPKMSMAAYEKSSMDKAADKKELAAINKKKK